MIGERSRQPRSVLERARAAIKSESIDELRRRARELERDVRSAIWRGSAPARRIHAIHVFLTWLANATKRQEPVPPPMPRRPFTLPDAAATLRKIESVRLALPTSDAPEASIVIPAYGHFEFTYACLEAIARNTDGPTYEVIVVDDCSPDATARMLDSVDGVRVVRNERNLGFIGACNAGADAARGRFLVFLNNDTEVQPGWLRELRGTFDLEPKAGIVGSKLVYPDGRLQEAGGIVWKNGAAWNVGRLGDPNDPQYQYLRRADYCSGACFMIPRELFRSLGGFDASFAPAYYEDTDLAFRVRAAGREVWYQPLSEVIHLEGLTCGVDLEVGVKKHQVINERKFAARWQASLGGHRPYAVAPELEQDRGVKGRILVVDVLTPEPDHHSGSLRMFNLLMVLRRLGYKVTFMPSNLVPMDRYTDELRRRGIEVLHVPYVQSMRAYVREHGERYDFIVLSRPEVAHELMPLTRRLAKRPRIIYDTVDLHHLREEREAVHKGDAELLRKARRRREQELRLVTMADTTLVVSTVEKELLERACPGARVRIVSNIHDVPGCAAPFSARRDLMFLGGFNHPPNVDAALWLVEEIMPLVWQRLPEAMLYLVGNTPPDEVQRLAGERVVVTGYVADLAPELARRRLSVAPLRYGAGVKGKINMSLSHGLPVVATPLAIEGMSLDPGRDVLVGRDAAQLAGEIVRLHGDEALWQALSDAGVRHTEKHFSFAAAASAMQHVIDELAPPRRASRRMTHHDGDHDAHVWIR